MDQELSTVVLSLKRSALSTNPSCDIQRLLHTVVDGQHIKPVAVRNGAKSRRFARVLASETGLQLLHDSLSEFALIEPAIRYTPQCSPQTHSETLFDLVVVDDGGQPLDKCPVVVVIADSLQRTSTIRGRTDQHGRFSTKIKQGFTVCYATAWPDGPHWSPYTKQPGKIRCLREKALSSGVGWWHHALGLPYVDEDVGVGIKVGVIDTGYGPHEALDHVEMCGFFRNCAQFDAIDEALEDDEELDILHGTHVCGIIGGRLSRGMRGWWGCAPGADLAVAVVEGSHVLQDDIALAIIELVERREVNLINISLSSPEGGEVLRAEIDAAERAGVLCICAAGNSGNEVGFPAAWPNTISVAAVGHCSTPEGTHARQQLEIDEGSDFGHFVHSARGHQIDCCGPGVGLFSTAPRAKGRAYDDWVEMSGTSMAAPCVTGVLATRLSKRLDYWKAPPEQRAAVARTELKDLCRSVGLRLDYEGAGMPVLPRVPSSNLQKTT